MTGQDEGYFDQIWKRKLQGGNLLAYAAGENFRVDKALSVIGTGRRVLDIGCGTGTLLAQLKRQYEEVHGIDISREAVGVACQNDIQARVIDLNSSPLPYADGFFDVVTVLSTLQYFTDLNKTLRECNRVISPDGLLLLSVPNMRAIWRIGKLLFLGSFPRVSLDPEGYDGGTLHYFAFSDLEKLLRKNGFCVKFAHGIFCVPAFVNRVNDAGLIGLLKREFFSAEVFVCAVKS
jgi:methionine biosynthesis protein MetW